MFAGRNEPQASISHASLVKWISNELYLVTATPQGGADRQRREKIARRTKAARHDLHNLYSRSLVSGPWPEPPPGSSTPNPSSLVDGWSHRKIRLEDAHDNGWNEIARVRIA